MDTPEFGIQLNINQELLTPDVIRGLSLHQVTEQFSTLGLQTRLFDALAQHDLDMVPEVVWATRFALYLHENDTRSNGHYTDHLMRVTTRVIEHFGITDPDIIAACILHDSVEDHPEDIVRILTGNIIEDKALARAFAVTLIAHNTNEEVAHHVLAVSNPILLPGEDKHEVYVEHTKLLVTKEPKARVVKLSDFIDNAVGNHYTRPDLQLHFDLKYVDLYPVHIEGLLADDCIIEEPYRSKILDQLQRGYDRCLTRLNRAA